MTENCARRKPHSKRSAIDRMHRSGIAAACLLTASLTGCASNNVVVEPVALPAVDKRLMAAPGIPRCSLPRRDDYDVQEVLAYARCYEAAYHALARRMIGLQRAVAVREAATATAVAARL